jgi:hypothetical protein
MTIAGISSSASDALLSSMQALLPAVGDLLGIRQAAAVREQATHVS